MALEAKQHELRHEHRQETGVFTEQELAQLCPTISAKDRSKLLTEAEKQEVGAR